MEGEAVDSFPYSQEAYTSILEYNQDRIQSGDYSDGRAQELFNTSLRYAIFTQNYRPLNVGDEDSDDDAPVSLGTSCVVAEELNQKIPALSQRDLLCEHNVLRPRSPQGWSNNQMDCSMHYGQAEPEFGRNFQLSAPAGGAYAGYGEAYNIIPDAIEPRIPGRNWEQADRAQANEVMTGDRKIAGESQHWRSPDNVSVVKIEEKAATAADRFLGANRHQAGFTSVRDDHLDGPVFSNFTSEEDEVGHFVDYSDSSVEFECDGNSSTSLTVDSRE